jgi:adenylate kinase family enzyme
MSDSPTTSDPRASAPPSPNAGSSADENAIDPDTGLTMGTLHRTLTAKIIIFLIGGPGSGKGTQAKRIIRDFDAGYITAGDLLRKEAASGTELGDFINDQMRQGLILPPDIEIRLLKNEIIAQEKRVYLIDGFPRKVEQVDAFEREVCPCKCALFLDVADDVLVARLGRSSDTSGREDDDPEALARRVRVFREVCELVYAHFDRTGRGVRIDGNRSPDKVYADTKARIERVVKSV